jgi:hypothetical protein
MPAIDPLAERRKEAQQAMEGEAHAKLRATKQVELQKQRELARRAMEGEERRKRRELREKTELKKKREQEAKEAAARAELEAKQKTETETMKAKGEAEATAQASRARKVESIEESESFINQLKTKALNLSPLRTFKTDMARAVQEEGISISKIALSEQARRKLGKVETEEQPKNTKLILPILLVILLVVGAGTYWWFYIRSGPTTPIINPAAPASFIFTEASRSLELKGDINEIHTLVNNEAGVTIPAKTIKYIYFTRNGATQSWNDFRQVWGLKIPSQLTRNLSGQFMFGVFNNELASNRFLILKTPDYPLAFRGLLDWEDTMADDILPLLRGSNATVKERTPSFIDKMIQNKDTRLLKSIDGQTVIIYSFLDPQTIVIAQNEATFIEIMTRYKNGANANSLAQ